MNFYRNTLVMRQGFYQDYPHPELLSSFNQLGKLLIKLNQEEEGQSYLQQAAAMQEADILYPAMKDTLNQLEQLLNNLTQTEENQEGVGES